MAASAGTRMPSGSGTYAPVRCPPLYAEGAAAVIQYRPALIVEVVEVVELAIETASPCFITLLSHMVHLA